jgi:hypothetical protein
MGKVARGLRAFDHSQATIPRPAHPVRSPSRSPAMHPIMSELFAKPVGWMTLGGLGFIVLMGLYLWWFARRKIREEEASK